MNPFEQYEKAWAELEDNVLKLSNRFDNGDGDMFQSMQMLNQEVYKLRADFDSYVKRQDDFKADLEAKMSDLIRRFDNTMGEHILPGHQALEGMKDAVRNHGAAVHALTEKTADLATRLTTIEGRVYG